MSYNIEALNKAGCLESPRIWLIKSEFIKGEIQNDETFAAAAATANHF
jgi:hypothetical protein